MPVGVQRRLSRIIHSWEAAAKAARCAVATLTPVARAVTSLALSSVIHSFMRIRTFAWELTPAAYLHDLPTARTELAVRLEWPANCYVPTAPIQVPSCTQERGVVASVQLDLIDGDIGVLTLDDPDRLNPLSGPLLAALEAALITCEQSRTLRALVVTGAGRGFCSGADMTEAGASTDVEGRSPVAIVLESQARIAEVHSRLHRLRVPVIAAVNGAAAGGGFTLALACDFRIAASSAKFVASFIKLGLSGADMGSSYFLPRLVGPARALEILMSGRKVYADEAERIGLVQQVVEDGTTLDAAVEFARTLTAHSPLGVWMTKSTVWHNVDEQSLGRAMEVENRTQTMCYGSGELEKAAVAFLSGESVTDWKSL